MRESPRISLVLPTRGRPNLVHRLLDSIVATAERLNLLEVLLRVDRDDGASITIEDSRLQLRKIVGPSGVKMGEMTRQCAKAANGRHFLLLNDDVVCCTHGWDTAIVEALEQFGDGVALVWCNDGFRGRRLANLPALSRRVCERMGGICPGDYQRDYIDTHLFDIFCKLKALGHDRLVYLENVLLEHLHAEAGKAPYDATYERPRAFADELAYIAWEERRAIIAADLASVIEGSSA